jgi:hypothetical protein
MLRNQIVSARSSATALALTGFALISQSCSVGGSGSSSFIVHRSRVSVAASTPVVIAGKYAAFLADEATTGPGGPDMNGDGDKIDSIATVINMSSGVETKLDVAATAMAWAGSELFLVVDESLDGRDWNANGNMTDTVLLHISATTLTSTPPLQANFDVIDKLAPNATKIVSYGTNVFYSSSRAPVNPTDSNLFVITSAAPTTATMVPTNDAVGPLSPKIIMKEEGLFFLSLDETAEGRDLNGDGDALDTNVLALMDGTFNTSAIRNTGLAMPAAGYVLRGRRTSSSSHDWSVGFLVSEADQGNTNLNDPALFAGTWKPSQCVGFEDSDTTDCVLHYLKFALWDADPVANPPVNTGLVGCRKIAIANNYIATITPEHDAADPNGAEGTCDLNGDGDLDDYVVRWVQMTSPTLPLTPAANIHALTNVPGGTHGLAELSNRFVIEVSEADDNLDINGDGLKTFDLVGWLLPSGSANTNTPWDFTHGGSPGATYVGASWMDENPDRSHMNLALEEKVMGVNINCHNPPIPGEDTDILDSVPTFPVFFGSPAFLGFPGIAIAVQTGNSGIALARNYGFYRVSEAEDSRDWNADGLETGFILFRTSLTQGLSAAMGPLNSIANRNSIEYNTDEATPVGCVFLADEQYQGAGGTDLNNDGDATDLVISYFVF